MRATVDAKEFSQALNKVIKVIKPASIPELEGVLVSISNDRCTLTATDFTTWLTTTIPARGDDLSFVFQRPKDAARACGHFEGELILEAEEKAIIKPAVSSSPCLAAPGPRRWTPSCPRTTPLCGRNRRGTPTQSTPPGCWSGWSMSNTH